MNHYPSADESKYPGFDYWNFIHSKFVDNDDGKVYVINDVCEYNRIPDTLFFEYSEVVNISSSSSGSDDGKKRNKRKSAMEYSTCNEIINGEWSKWI